uniref:Uncharacterized protein n=1 Tax=Monodon monoceros TaxID=40151 RepID=A0A8C6F2Q3_MONMO
MRLKSLQITKAGEKGTLLHWHSALQLRTTGLKQSSCFSLLSSWDYRHTTVPDCNKP